MKGGSSRRNAQSDNNAPSPLRQPDAARPLPDAAMERAALVHAGKTVNATMTAIIANIARSDELLEAKARANNAADETSARPLSGATESGVFRLEMTRAFLSSQLALFAEVRAALLTMVAAASKVLAEDARHGDL